MQGESCAGADLRAVPLLAQQVGQGKAGKGGGPWAREGGRSPASPGKGGTHSPHHQPPSSAAIWRPCPGWRVVVTFSPSPSPESFTCRLVVPALLGTVPGRKVPSMAGHQVCFSAQLQARRTLRVEVCWDAIAHTMARLPYWPLCHPFPRRKVGEQSLQLSAAACREELSPLLCQAVPSAQRRCPSPIKPSLPPGWAVCLCFCGQRLQALPSPFKVAPISAPFC